MTTNRDRSTEAMDDKAHFYRYLKVLSPIDGMVPLKSVIYQRTMELLIQDVSQGQLPHTIRMMLIMAGADDFLPPQYAGFQTVVMEGALFLLTRLPRERIAEKIVDQLVLPMDAEPGKRICELVKDMPTLHKLIQIIGRSPGIDPQFKESLIQLEDNVSTVTYEALHQQLIHGLYENNPCSHVNLKKEILAEASVCAVVAGTVSGRDKASSRKTKIRRITERCKSKKGGQVQDTPMVFKMVKPAIKKNMAAELALWGRLGDFLDTNKKKWGLDEFQFKGTIDQVSRLLHNEIDLHLEQQNLDAVTQYYHSDPLVLIPEKSSLSTPDITVMTRLDGNKITDVEHLSRREKRILAQKVTRLCILQPIIDLEQESIFHGDPHAGNIAYRFEGCKPEIIFYDWAMVGRLNRLERLAVILMISGLIAGNATVIYYAADIMAEGKITSDPHVGRKILDIITDLIQSREKRIQGVLSSVEFLIEQIMYQGVVFSSDLLVFEKGLVTLKGVLADIDPSFDRDEYVIWSAATQLASDFAHFRIQSMIVRELWSLYKYSFSLFIDIQKTILGFGWDMVRNYGMGNIVT